MHAAQILHRFSDTHLQAIHAARRGCLTDAVWSVMQGSALRLSAVGRGMVRRQGTFKAALKRIDRLIGNPRIETESSQISRTILQQLCALRDELTIAVDWSSSAPGGRWVQLRASVVLLGMGRAITVYQQVYPQSLAGSPESEQTLLAWLESAIPSNVRVTLITDAGFRRPWFVAIAQRGWSWIGRVRGGTKLHVPPLAPDWITPAQCFDSARRKPQRWLDCELTKTFAWPCDLVIHRRPRQHRVRYETPNRNRYRKAVIEAQTSHKEPWLLACSPDLRHLRPDEILALYALRMQIEETFRDTKSPTFSMGMQTCRSRSSQRLLGLLVLAMLAAFLLWHLGQLAEAEGFHRRHRATTRRSRELSLISLGRLLCRETSLPLSSLGLSSLAKRIGIRA